MKKTKRAISLLVLLTMLTSLFAPMTAAAENTAECRTYLAEEKTFDGAAEKITTADDINFVKGMESGTVTAKFKTESTELQALVAVSGTQSTNDYVSFYISGGTRLGLEVRDNPRIHKYVDLSESFADGKEHTVTYRVEKGVGYKFYLDGQLAGNLADTSAAFVAAEPWAASNMRSLSFGGADRISGNNYLYTGSLKDVKIYNRALTDAEIFADHAEKEREDLVYQFENGYFTAGTSYTPDTTEGAVAALKALEAGTITVRYRAEAANNGLMALFSISDNTNAGKYLDVFVQPSANKVGFETMGGTGTNAAKFLVDLKGKNVNNTEWHTLTLTKTNDANQRYTVYLDGVDLGFFSNMSKFFNGIDTANTIGIGFTDRASGNEYNFKGAIDSVKVYSTVLTAEEITAEHNKIAFESETVEDLTGVYKTESEALYYAGYDGSIGYRIPSLLTTEAGTVIAGIDKRQSGQGDAGNIDMAVRRKEKGADEFGDPIIVMDMNNNGGDRPAFFIDSCLVEDKNTGRVYMVVDMFPESNGLMTAEWINTGTGHETIDGKHYKELYTDGTNAGTKFGTIREDGVVYDKDGNKTDYVVITECQAPYQELGNLYKDGEFKGNIYRYSGPDKGELSVLRTQYLWVTYSEDDGETWSLPQDITAQVKLDWMKFLGTGPGVGIQLENGKLAVPVYSAGTNVGGTQSSAIIISEDGENWTLKESPNPDHDKDANYPILTESQLIQTPNGDLHLFMRNTSGKVKESVSKDEGTTWTTPAQIAAIPDVYCQLTVTTYEKDGKMYVILANPSGEKTIGGSKRAVGKVYIGEVGEDNTTITWADSKYLNQQRYGYSCITVIDNDGVNPKFGLFYEDETTGPDMLYMEFDEAWVKNTKTVQTTQEAPQLLEKQVTVEGNILTVALTFDQVVMAAGNPKLTLAVGAQTFTADYVSGSTTDTITFAAEIPAGAAGLVKLTGVDEAAGYLENTINGKPVIGTEVLYDLTEIKSGVTMHDYSSQHSNSTAENADGAAVNVLDGNPNTYWHSTWGNASITLPQWVTVKFDEVKTIYKMSYLPRQNSQSGRVRDYEVLGSTDGTNFTLLTDGTFDVTAKEQYAEFTPADVQYIRFKVNTSTAGTSCSVAELNFFEYEEGVMEAGDTAALEALVASIANLNEADYSSATWAKLAAAKEKAEALLATEGIIPQTMVDNTYNALAAAKKQLVTLAPAAEMKAQYAALKEADYTKESWTAFTAAMADVDIDARLNAALIDRQVTDVIMKVNYEMSKLVKAPVDPEKVIYTVYVDGEEYTTGKYNAKVSVHADKENFVCWMASSTKDGQQSVVSVNPDYTFYIAGNVYLTAVYEEMTINPAATLVNTIAIPAKDGKVNARFVGQLTVPEGAKIERAGLVWSTKNTPETLVLGAEGAKVTDVKSVNKAYQFSVTINGMPKDRFVRGVIFAEIVNADGTTTYTADNIYYSVEGTIRN